MLIFWKVFGKHEQKSKRAEDALDYKFRATVLYKKEVWCPYFGDDLNFGAKRVDFSSFDLFLFSRPRRNETDDGDSPFCTFYSFGHK